MSNHLLTRVYPNGEAKETVRDLDGVKNWVAYNLRFRPGCALLIDGRCVAEGSLRTKDVKYVEYVLDKELSQGDPTQEPDKIEYQNDDGHTYIGYRPEPYRERFKW
jgi:hypothetical protein